MIIEEKFERNNIKLVKHYSDSNLKIKQKETGIKYDIAIDIEPCKYHYIETTEHIDDNNRPNENEVD